LVYLRDLDSEDKTDAAYRMLIILCSISRRAVSWIF